MIWALALAKETFSSNLLGHGIPCEEKTSNRLRTRPRRVQVYNQFEENGSTPSKAVEVEKKKYQIKWYMYIYVS